jgi:hypothetical protein
MGMSLVEYLGALNCAHHVDHELERELHHAFRAVHLAVATNHLHHVFLNQVLYELAHS